MLAQSRSSRGPSAWTRISPWPICRLGVSYSNVGETARAAESMRKAYELRGRTSEQEKLAISSDYEELRHWKFGGSPQDLRVMGADLPA